MVTGLESITVAVDDLDAALAALRDVPGLRRESDAHASVALLSAWHYPVHADVRLIELSQEGRTLGRVRLARFDPDVGRPPGDFQPAAMDSESGRHFYREGLGLAKDIDASLPKTLRTTIDRIAGIYLFTLSCPDLDALEARLGELEAEVVTRPTHVALGNGTPTRILLARGPNQELLEFVERTEP